MQKKLSIFSLFLLSLISLHALSPFDERKVCLAEDAAGNQVAVWEENEMIMASEQPDQGNWSMPVILSNPATAASLPQLEIDPFSGEATAIWLENQSIKAASKPWEGKWGNVNLEPTLVEEDSEESMPRKRVAIALVLPAEDEARNRSYPGAFTPPKAGSRRKKGGKTDSKPTPYRPSRFKDGKEKLREPMANAIDAPTSSVLSGGQIGFAAGTAAPTNGLIVSGQLGVGTSSPNAGAKVHVASTIDNAFGYGMLLQNTFQPSSGGTEEFQVNSQPTFIAPMSQTITDVAAIFASNTVSSNVGTISNAYGVWIGEGTSGSGTITNAYGLYATTPGHGTQKAAIYGDNLSIGYVATTPPTSGAIILGHVGIGQNSAPSILNVHCTTAFADSSVLRLEGFFQGANSGDTRTALLVDPSIVPTFSGTIGNAFNTWLFPNFQPASGCTITNGVALYVDAGFGAGGGTVTNGYGIYCFHPNYGNTRCALYTDDLSIGYPSTTPPTNGAIISGHVGIGTSGPGTTTTLTVLGSANDTVGAYVGGTFTPNSSTVCGFQVNPTFIPTPNTTSAAAGILLNPDIRADSGKTISNGIALDIFPIWANTAGTITIGWNALIESGSASVTGGGSISTLIGLQVARPTAGGNNFTAVFGGSGATLNLDSTGLLYPDTNKGVDLGKNLNRFNTGYFNSTVTVSSRVGKAQVLCPTCGVRMIRATGTLILGGEEADYIPCWCPNSECVNKGRVHMEELRHLSLERLKLRKPPPKIEFLGFSVKTFSGNSYGVQLRFRYVDRDPNDPKLNGPLENVTTFTDVEYAEFLALPPSERLPYILALGIREWNALEETRLLEEDAATVERTLNELTAELLHVDLLKQ
jgi:hypothetical protein